MVAFLEDIKVTRKTTAAESDTLKISAMAVLMTSRWSTRTSFCYLILGCLIYMRKAKAVGVLSERDDGRGIQGKFDEKFLKNARESFYSVAGKYCNNHVQIEALACH